jgi:hypothetical protein
VFHLIPKVTAILRWKNLRGRLSESERPDFWELFRERYLESKLDHKSGQEVLKNRHRHAGEDCLRLPRGLNRIAPELRYGQQVELLRGVFAQQYLVKAGQAESVKEHAPGVVRNPHDPDAQWSAKGQGKEKKNWMGYKVQMAESLPKKDALSQKRFITSIVTQKAIASDDPGLDAGLADQALSGLDRPIELYVDGAYLSAARLQEAKN